MSTRIIGRQSCDHLRGIRTRDISSEICRTKKVACLPNAYDPLQVESHWIDWWNDRRYYGNHKEDSGKLRGLLCLPPPNITGNLHVGHALTVAIQDAYVRWRDMTDQNVVWVPGFDHAGIATQLVVDKWLLNEKGISRRDISRSEFVEHCMEWKRRRAADIRQQLDRLGASLDWKQCYYTMDKNFSYAVQYAFRCLYNEGLIFRDLRLVNWSPFLQSTLSDVEIEFLKVDQPVTFNLPDRNTVEVGCMYHIKYDLVNPVDRITHVLVATTRPETIPADVALAVRPDDLRYTRLIGSYCRNPLVPHRLLPVIADEQIDAEFGTGVLKITPGHDRTDFDISQKHQLDVDKFLNIFDDKGNVIDSCMFEPTRNKSRFCARQIILDYLEASGKLFQKRAHATSLPVCARTGDLVEMMPKNQWFLNCRPLASRISQMISMGQFRVFPDFQKTLMKNWLGNTQDWCLSRQLWWGHQIPAYRLATRHHHDKMIKTEGINTDYVIAADAEDARKQFSKIHEIPRDELFVEQDDDVLDTWFSSALVPLVVSGWPIKSLLNENKDDAPLLSLMETGHDILGLWVTRMAMLGVHFTGRLPFRDILLHGIIRDSQGRKMSKSLGNVIDPVDVIEGRSFSDLQNKIISSSLPEKEKELSCLAIKTNFPKGIPQCGADALRFSLLSADVKNVTMNIDVDQIENRRHFCNKIWQSFRFMKKAWKTDSVTPITLIRTEKDPSISNLTNEDLWILSRLDALVQSVSNAFDSFDFHVATNALYRFWWHEFCDIYLEFTKSDLWKIGSPEEDQCRCFLIARIFFTVSDVFLRLLAPFMPFLAEELYAQIPLQSSDNLSVHDCRFPDLSEVSFCRPELDSAMRRVQDMISGVRALKKQFGLLNSEPIIGFIVADDISHKAISLFPSILNNFAKFSYELCASAEFDIEKNDAHQFVHYLAADGCQIYLKINDVKKSAMLEALEKQLVKKRKIRDITKSKMERSLKISRLNPKMQPIDKTATLEELSVEIKQIEQIYERLQAHR